MSKAISELADKTYLRRIPDTIPDGWVIVHNHIEPPTRRLSTRGFRAWLQRIGTDPAIEVCGCAWAPEFVTHYRPKKGKEAP